MRTLREVVDQSISTKQRLAEDDEAMAAAQQLVDALVACYRAGGRLYLCGNGGSAADAQHFAAELTGHFIFDRPPLAAEALHGNSSHMTCVANDYQWDQVFARALAGSAREGDVLVCLSTSGNSDNVLRAAEVARDLGVTVAGFTGASGGALHELCDISIRVPSEDTGRIQESHITLIHGISEQVEHLMFADQHGASLDHAAG